MVFAKRFNKDSFAIQILIVGNVGVLPIEEYSEVSGIYVKSPSIEFKISVWVDGVLHREYFVFDSELDDKIIEIEKSVNHFLENLSKDLPKWAQSNLKLHGYSEL